MTYKSLNAFIITLGVFIVVLGTTSVNVALPRMIAPLRTDIFGIEWVSLSYLISTAITMLLFNFITKKIGVKRVYILGLLFYLIGSWACGRAESLFEMIVFRSVQGIGEGFLIPAGQVMLQLSFPPEERGFAMGIYAMGMSFAPGLGPTIGGYMIEYISWRSIFYLNIPIALPLLFLAITFLPSYHTKYEKANFNFISFLFLAIFSVSTLILISKGEDWGWFYSLKTFYAFTISILSFLFFLLSELLTKNPLIDLRVIKDFDFTTSVTIFVIVQGLTFFQIVFALPIYFEKVRNLSSFETGLHIFSYAFGIGIFSLIGGKLSDKINPRFLILTSELIIFLILYNGFINIDYFTPREYITKRLFFIGVGMGLFFAPILKLAFRTIEKEILPLASALYGYMRLFGASIGTSIATNIITKNTAYHFDNISNMDWTHIYTAYYLLSNFERKINLGEKAAKMILYNQKYLYSSALAIEGVFSFASITIAISFFITIFMILLEKRFTKV